MSRRFRCHDLARGGSHCQSGSLVMISAIVSVTSSPSNARFAVSISNSTHPNAQMSLCLWAGRPFACSVLMYAAVPRMMPTPVIIAGVVIVGDCDTFGFLADAVSSAFASPKSNTLRSRRL
jgi:hypothetical protein